MIRLVALVSAALVVRSADAQAKCMTEATCGAGCVLDVSVSRLADSPSGATRVPAEPPYSAVVTTDATTPV